MPTEGQRVWQITPRLCVRFPVCPVHSSKAQLLRKVGLHKILVLLFQFLKDSSQFGERNLYVVWLIHSRRAKGLQKLGQTTQLFLLNDPDPRIHLDLTKTSTFWLLQCSQLNRNLGYRAAQAREYRSIKRISNLQFGSLSNTVEGASSHKSGVFNLFRTEGIVRRSICSK